MTRFLTRGTRALACCVAALAIGIGVAACGGGSPTTTTTSTAGSSAVQQSNSGSAATGATAGIPQHNGGDQDADNNGAPSDGDGDI